MPVFEKIFGYREREDGGDEEYVDDPVMARECDAGMVEWGLLSKEEFDRRWPESPFLSPAELEERRAAGVEDPLTAYLRRDESTSTPPVTPPGSSDQS